MTRRRSALYRACGLALALSLPSAALQAATIQGRVIHPTRPAAAAGLEISILGVRKEGGPVDRTTRSDAEGRFRIDGLPAPAAYLVGATFDGLPFPGQSVVFREGSESASKSIHFHVYDRSEDGQGIAILRQRWIIEREATVYRVRQSVTFTNPNPRVVLHDDDAPPLLRLGLAPGHGVLETPFGRTPDGFRVSGDAVELRGPIYPGDRELHFAYDVPSQGADLVTEISLPEATESFELFVRDFGIVVDAGSLHPARAIREADAFYQRWMGFDLPAGTRIPVHVSALPPRSPTSPWLNALVAAFGTAGLLIWVGRPATARGTRSATTAEDPADLEPEKAALIAALEDLEHDYETGKLSASDREQLREELRREALHALAQRRAASGATEPERVCTCGKRPGSADRFCSDCGARL